MLLVLAINLAGCGDEAAPVAAPPPGGDFVIMASRTDGPTAGGPSRLVVYDGEGRLLGDGPGQPGATLTPSPSGSTVIVDRGTTAAGRFALNVVGSSGTTVAAVPEFEARCWDWNDDEQLIVARSVDGSTEVELRSTRTETTRHVVTLPSDWCVAGRDGESAVVFGSGIAGRNAVAILDLEAGTVQPIAEFDCNLGDVRVSPDGQTAAISAACVGAKADPATEVSENVILLVDLNDGSSRSISDGVWTSPSFTPDGRSIIAADLSPSGSPDTSRLVRIDLSSNERTVLVEGESLMLPMVLPGEWRPS